MSKDKTAIVKVTPAAPLRQVVTWIIDGHTEADITEALAKQFPGAKAKPVIIEALKEIADAGDPDPTLVRGFALEGTKAIYRKCMEVADHQTALRALKQLTDLAKTK